MPKPVQNGMRSFEAELDQLGHAPELTLDERFEMQSHVSLPPDVQGTHTKCLEMWARFWRYTDRGWMPEESTQASSAGY